MKKCIPKMIWLSFIAISCKPVNQAKITSMKLKAMPFYRRTYIAIDEQAIEKSEWLKVKIKDRHLLSEINDHLINLTKSSNQNIVPNIRLRCRIRFPNKRSKNLYFLLDGMIMMDGVFYNENPTLFDIMLKNAPEYCHDYIERYKSKFE